MSRIYFAAADNRVKIGITSRGVHTRLKDISAHLSSPLELIGDIPGSLLVERTIQQQLSEFRLKGEWFRDCPEIRAAIADILRNPPLPLSSRKTKDEFKPKEQTPEEYGAMTARMANMLWPDDALHKMAAFTGVPEEDCRGWLAGTFVPPEVARYAFAARFIEWMTAKHREEQLARGAAGGVIGKQ